MLYLDNAATTLIKPNTVVKSMISAISMAASPGRGGHYPAMKAAEIVYSCREKAAELFNVPEAERVVFTMNATHALNIAINSLVKKGMKVLVSGYEHNSVIRPLAALGAEIMVAEAAPFDSKGVLDAFEQKIKEAELVICTHVSNVFGFILPIYEISLLCRNYNVPIIIDASQSAGVLDLDFLKLGADFIAMPGHKALFGPQGTGLLLCGREGKPLLSGGSGSDSRSITMPEFLPDRLEAGTHNVLGIAGLMAGIQYVQKLGLEKIKKYESELLSTAVNYMKKVDGLELFADSPETQISVLSFRVKNFDCEELAQSLAEKGVCVRAGMHCSPLAHRSANTIDSGTVRISFSPFVTPENVEEFCFILQNLLNSNA